MSQKERFELLKNACEEALKCDPKVLEGKELVYSEKSGKAWEFGIYGEFMKVPETEVRICIAATAEDMYRIVVSKNMRWQLADEYIKEKIKEKNRNIMVSSKSIDYILGFTVTF